MYHLYLEGVREEVRKVEKFFKVRIIDSGRSKTASFHRDFVYYVLHEIGYSYPEIGTILNRDHSSVVYGVRRFTKRLSTDERMMVILKEVRNLLSDLIASR